MKDRLEFYRDYGNGVEAIAEIPHVRTEGDPEGAQLWRINGRLYIRVFTQGGHDLTGIDLEDLLGQLDTIKRMADNA